MVRESAETTGDTARSKVFARIRHASRRQRAEQIARELAGLGRSPAAALPARDMSTAFLLNVVANRGSIACAKDRSAAVKAVGQFLYEHHRSQRLVAGNDPRLAAMPWRDAGVLPRFGSIGEGESVALSYARLGVAEAGAVVTFTGRANPAANNLLAEQQIVLIDSGDLVADFEAAWEKIDAEMAAAGRPRGVNFIAGPSSTADIEGKLVYGAHGPRGWHVILLAGEPDALLSRVRELAEQAAPSRSSSER